MPKSIIREFDNSTANPVLAANFAVVVPGYMGVEETEESIEAAKKAGIYLGDAGRGVYELRTQAQFDQYIGKFPGQAEPADAPELETLVAEAQGIDKYFKHLSTEDIFNAYDFALANDGYCYIYSWVEIFDGEEWGTNGKWKKTFTEAEQEDATTDDNDTLKERTFKFTPLTTDELKSIEMNNGLSVESYVKIFKDHQGKDAISETHIGNQIAYELLGLGYTVLFKKLDKNIGATAQLSDSRFWEPLKDKSTYNFRYLMSGGCYDSEVMNRMAALADFKNDVSIEEAETYGVPSGRGDVIALCDVNEGKEDGKAPVDPSTMESLLTTMKASIDRIQGNKYTAIFAPRVVYNMKAMKAFGYNVTFPASFHYLACAAQARTRYAEWYAVAGYTRGVAAKSIAYTTLTFGDIAINTLAPRVINNYATKAVNLILCERGNYYLWGNRTAYALDNKGLIFSHFLNIRQLCTTLKKVLYQASRGFTFDPNSDRLWLNFVAAIRPTLENMKVDQGIQDYRISRVAVEDGKKALLIAKIRIVPIEALEDFDISVYLEDSLSGVVISSDEEVAE